MTPDLILPSPAKLNLFLHIVGRRDDGYHELQTLFQFLDYGDELSFTLTPGEPGVGSASPNGCPWSAVWAAAAPMLQPLCWA